MGKIKGMGHEFCKQNTKSLKYARIHEPGGPALEMKLYSTLLH